MYEDRDTCPRKQRSKTMSTNKHDVRLTMEMRLIKIGPKEIHELCCEKLAIS